MVSLWFKYQAQGTQFLNIHFSFLTDMNNTDGATDITKFQNEGQWVQCTSLSSDSKLKFTYFVFGSCIFITEEKNKPTKCKN